MPAPPPQYTHTTRYGTHNTTQHNTTRTRTYLRHVPRQTGNARRAYQFHIRGHTLTFSAGAMGAPLTLQPGSWTLPSEFYLLLATYRLGYEFRVTFAPPSH